MEFLNLPNDSLQILELDLNSLHALNSTQSWPQPEKIARPNLSNQLTVWVFLIILTQHTLLTCRLCSSSKISFVIMHNSIRNGGFYAAQKERLNAFFSSNLRFYATKKKKREKKSLCRKREAVFCIQRDDIKMKLHVKLKRVSFTFIRHKKPGIKCAT